LDERTPDPEFGRRLFAQACEFVLGVAESGQLPDSEFPEIAFAGRSNVGKSSLVNALIGQKTLARTSNSPGRTRQINLFDLGGRLMIADLPGYGFARAPKEVVRKWTELVDLYLRGRAQLRRVCLLIDSRHGLKDSDRRVMRMLDEAAVSYQVILTKSDKISAAELSRRGDETAAEIARHVAAHPEILSTSAREKAGIPELRTALAELVGK
jgi:GTP-binding protein